MKFFSPSSADRWVPCPGSVKISQPFAGKIKQSEAAAEGEAAHWVAEQAAKRLPIPDLTPNGTVVTQEMRDGAAIYAALLPDTARIEEWRTCTAIHPEMGKMRVDASFDTEETNTLTVVDYKFGMGNVEAVENLQLLASVAGFSYSKRKNLELVIVQPRVIGEPPVKSWRLTVEEYNEKWFPLLQAAAAEVVSENPKCNTGSHCVFCPARHACKALAGSSHVAVEMSTEATMLDLDATGLGIELEILLTAAERLKHRIAGVESQVIAALNAGNRVEGFTLQQSYSNLKWTQPTEKVLAAAKMLGVNILKPQEPLTPTQSMSAGLPESVVNKLASRQYTGDKLKRIDMAKLRRAFSNTQTKGN